MERRIPALWVASAAYAVGLAILVPVTLDVAGRITFGHSGAQHSPGDYFGDGWAWLLLAAGFFSGGTAYFFSARYSSFLIRWAATVVAAVGGTIALISLPFVVFDVLGAFLVFTMGAFLAGLEAFLVTGFLTAIVLAGEWAVARSSSDRDLAPTGNGPSVIELAMLLIGGAALCLSLAGAGRVVKGLGNLSSLPTP